MYVIDTAVSGGHSLWASSATVYNELVTSRPETIRLLAKNNWPFDE
jgi:Taurine catabolism dioxygenase TauD, TfdA family